MGSGDGGIGRRRQEQLPVAIEKRRLTAEVVSGSGEEIQEKINNWLSDPESQDKLMFNPLHRIDSTDKHYAIFYYVAD